MGAGETGFDAARVERILARLRHTGPTAPCLATLRTLQHRFLREVPFENLDIHLGRPIALDPDAFYAKIVEEGRGGFCYECNGLFEGLLRGLGFRTRRVSARMAIGPDAFAGEFGHMALLVEVDGADVLADVGNGQSCRDPMPVPGDAISEAEGLAYKVDAAGDEPGAFELRVRDASGGWAPRFRFTRQGHPLEAFDGACRFHQTSPLSPFTKQPLATLALEDGRLLLVGRTLRERRGDAQRETPLPDAASVRAVLAERFGIRLPPGADAAL